MLDNLDNSIVLLNKDQEILWANKLAVKIANKENIIGKKCYKVYHNSEKPISNCPLCNVLITKKTNTEEVSIGKKIFKITCSKINVGLKEDLYLHTSVDITDIVKTKKQLEVALKKAKESDMLKSAFLSNMSHEIRTPINVINGFVDLLINSETSDEDKIEYAGYVNSNSRYLLKLIDDILNLSRIESGNIEMVYGQAYIEDIFLELYMSFRHIQREYKKEHIKFIFNKDLDNNNFKIYTDSHRLKQVIANLINNAFKFTEQGSIEIGYYLHNNNIRCYVKDTGYGIEKSDLKKIFERFIKINNTENKTIRGSGLGLAISKELIGLLGGKIFVESTLGIGTTFYVDIPYKQDEFIKFSQIEPALPSFNWKDKKILVAEDEDDSFQILMSYLKKSKANIIRAKNGQDLLDLFEIHKDASVVIMDLNMSVLDGYEATKIIKRRKPELPVVVLTALAMKNQIKKAYDSGANNVITKPCDYNSLREKLDLLIN